MDRFVSSEVVNEYLFNPSSGLLFILSAFLPVFNTVFYTIVTFILIMFIILYKEW